MNPLRILCIGDVVGPCAVTVLKKHLWKLRKDCSADAVITNGENAALGNGLDTASAKSLLFSGTDVITSGNHIWQKKEIREFLNNTKSVIRPANYPAVCPGTGYTYCNARGYRILVLNVLGTTFMDALESPFITVERILEREAGKFDFSVLDIHAEATSEKMAIGKYFDGKITIIFGTHTHVQTADARIFQKGTGYITDLGMTGPADGILGVKNECIIEKLTTKMPVRFELAEGNILLCGCLFSIDTDSGRIIQTEPIQKEYQMST